MWQQLLLAAMAAAAGQGCAAAKPTMHRTPGGVNVLASGLSSLQSERIDRAYQMAVQRRGYTGTPESLVVELREPEGFVPSRDVRGQQGWFTYGGKKFHGMVDMMNPNHVILSDDANSADHELDHWACIQTNGLAEAIRCRDWSPTFEKGGKR